MTPLALAQLALFTPAAVAVLLAVCAPLRRRGSWAASLSIGAVTVSLLASGALLVAALEGAAPAELTFPWMPGPGGRPLAELGLRVDGTSSAMLAVVALVAFCVQVFSFSYLDDEPAPAVGRYYTWQSLFVFAMGTLVLAPNLLQLFIGWELVGLASYLLIGHWFRKPSAAKAAVKAFWVTKLADAGLLFALFALYTETGTFRWDLPLDPAWATFATLMLLFAVAGKSAQFPLHVWLPDAMEGPTPVSALLHAATMVAAGVFLVVRAWPLFELAPLTGDVMAWAGALTAVFGALLAVVQTDIKKMLAYSTCSQLGYMLAALGAGSLLGGYFHLLTHAAFKALLFLAAGNVIHAVHSNELARMGGLGRHMRWTSAAFIVGALALAGVPGLSGAFSKDLVLEGVYAKGLYGPWLLLLAGVPLTAFYMGRAALRTFFGAPASPEAEHAHEAPWGMRLPVLVLAVPTVLAGWFGASLGGLVGAPYELHLGLNFALASAFALGGLGGAFWLHRSPAARALLAAPLARLEALDRAGLVDRAWRAGYDHVLMGVGRASAWFDRYVVDAAINALGAGALAAGRRLRPTHTGRVPDYLLAVSAGAALLALWGIFQ